MPLPSLSPIALEILVPVAALLILAAAFLAVLFCAIVGAGLGRLLYLGARSCANRVLPIFAPIQSVAPAEPLSQLAGRVRRGGC